MMAAHASSFTNVEYHCFSGRSDGAGVKRRHCQSYDDEAAAVLRENRPYHCGSDGQGQCLYLDQTEEKISFSVKT